MLVLLLIRQVGGLSYRLAWSAVQAFLAINKWCIYVARTADEWQDEAYGDGNTTPRVLKDN
jgi:hypothetical protein